MQLLISVKNVEEALLALNAGADLIDLKDPNIGALGALDLASTAQIVQALAGRATLSATAGEHHASLSALLADVEARVDLGVDIIKIAVGNWLHDADFLASTLRLTHRRIKLVAVFFADTAADSQSLTKLNAAGFYGAMLDTEIKQLSLLEHLQEAPLRQFVSDCEQNKLISGLAGSLKPQDVDFLQRLRPTFIGFRGGACQNNQRESSLCEEKIGEIKKMLPKHNKFKGLAQKSLNFALHTGLSLGIVEQ